MPYLLQALSSWSIAALALGLVVGFVTCEPGRAGSLRGWPKPALVLYGVGLAAAVLQVLPGRYGFWLETALLLGAAYVLGCLLGCLLQGLFAARPAKQTAALQRPDAVSAGAALVASGAAKEVLAEEKSEVAAPSAEPVAPAADAAMAGLSEGVQVLSGHAEALALAVPAALAASGAAEKLLGGEKPAQVAAPSAEPAAPATDAAMAGLSEGVQVLTGHAEALALAVPAALAASGAAEKLLGGEKPAQVAAPSAEPAAPAADAAMAGLSEGVQVLGGHAEALAVAAPAALAAFGAAEKLLAGEKPAQVAAPSAEPAAPAADAAMAGLSEGVQVLGGHAEALAVAAPAALAAFGAAEKLLAGEKPAQVAAPSAEPAAPATDAAMAGLSEGVRVLTGHAEALAVAAPAALAASGAAQKLLSETAARAPSPAPVMEKPDQEEGEDELRRIDGIGKKMMRKLHDLGVRRLGQIAVWTPEQARRIGEQIGEPGRVESENWIKQARLLFGEGEAEFFRAAPERRTASPPPSIERPARAGDEDDLCLIRGVGEKIARELHDAGVWRFSQIAAWTPEQEQWIGEKFVDSGPVARKYWVAQARLLASGVETEYSRAVRSGEARQDTQAHHLDESAAAALHAALPAIIATHANDEIYAGQRPLSLLQPPHGDKDDLARIEGTDQALANRLNALGIWTYAQIARWSIENARWVSLYLAIPGRVEREDWIKQARALAMREKTSA